MSQQNKLNNRLEDLFEDLENQATQFRVEKETLPGWTWECDTEGIYTQCSPEINDILGLNPEDVIGESLFSYHTVDQSETNLVEAFEKGDFPCDIDLHYFDTDDEIVFIRAHVFPIESIDETHRGWRGLNNVIAGEIEKSSVPASPPPRTNKEIDRQMGQLLPFPSMGVEIEDNQRFSTDRPSSSPGVISLLKKEARLEDSSPENPAAINFPVDLPGQTLDILEIIDDSPDRKWSPEDRRLAEQVADQLGLALENARLFQQTQTSLSRTEALYNVGQAAIGFENIEELLQGVVNTLSNVVPADRAQIAIININKQIVTHYFQSYSPPLDIGASTFPQLMDGLTGWCIREREPALSPKGHIDTRESEEIQKKRVETDAGSVIVAPLIYRDITFGSISVINKNSQQDFSHSDVDLLVAMATQVATALANARLFQEEQRRRRIADTLSETARVVGATLELEDVGNSLLDQLADAIDFDNASLQIFEGSQRRLIAGLNKIGHEKKRMTPKILESTLDNFLLNTILETKQPLVISDTQTDSRWNIQSEGKLVRSWIGAPLISGEEVIGLLFLDHSEPGAYDEDSADFISAIAAQVTGGIRNAGLFQQTQQRSVQLQTAAEVSRAASSILEPGPLIHQTVNLIQERFNTYYVGLFLVDETGELTNEPGRWAVLRSGTGEAGRIQIERQHKLEIAGESMIGVCIRTAEAQTPQSISSDITRLANPLLPKTRTEIALPLISRGIVIGAMSIQSEIEHAFSHEDIAILQTMADQVANSLQNAYLFDQTQVRADELAVLNEMSGALSEKLDINSTLSNVYLFASRLIDTSTFSIALFDDGKNEVSFPFSTVDNRETKIPTRQMGTGLTEYVINNQEVVLIKENIKDWLRKHGVETHLTEARAKSWLGVPMVIGNQILGILSVQHQDPYRFSEQHRDLLIAIANQSAIALQNAQLFTQTQEALSETEALLNITSVASSSFDIQVTLSDVLNRVLDAIKSSAGLITLHDPNTNKLELVAHRLPEGFVSSLKEKGLEGSLCDLVDQQKSSIVLEDLTQDAPTDVSGIIALGFRSFQGVPIEAKGRVLGTLCTFSNQIMPSADNDLSLLLAVGQQIGVAVENATLFEQIQDQAEELAVLNEMSRELSTLLNIDEITKTIHNYTSRLMDTTNFFVALYNQREDELSFPYVFEEGEFSTIPTMKKRRGLTQHVIDTKQPLLIAEDVKQKIVDLGLEEIVIGQPAESWLGVPLIIGDEVLGVITVQNAEIPHVFNQRHQEMLVSVARQSATAIQTAHLFTATRRQTDDLAVLNEMSRVLTTLIDRDEILRTVYNFASKIMDTTNFIIATHNPRTNELVVEIRIQEGEETQSQLHSPDKEITEYIIKSGEPLLLEDDVIQHVERLNILSHPLEDTAHIYSWLGAPMLLGEDSMGVIRVMSSSTPRLFDERHRDLLVAIASQTAISLQNARLIDQTQKQLSDLTLLSTASQSLSSASPEVHVISDILTEQFMETMGVPEASLSLFIDSNTLETISDIIKDDVGSEKRVTTIGERFKLEDYPLTRRIIENREPAIVYASDESADPAELTYMEIYDVLTLVIIPLIVKGEAIGIIELESWEEEIQFPDDLLNLALTMANQGAVALENARLFDQTQQQLENLTIIQETTSEISESLSFADVCNSLLTRVSQASHSNSSSLFIVQENSIVLEALYPIPPDEDNTVGKIIQLEDNPLTQEVIKTRQPLVVSRDDESNDSNGYTPNSIEGKGIQAIIPMIGSEGVLGVLSLSRKLPGEPYKSQEINLASTLASQAVIALENARLYEEQLETAEQLRELDQLKTQFLANMSHELRTPLNSIIGFSRVIMKGIDGPVSDLQQQDLAAIYNAGQHLLTMINDILDISKIDAGKMELAFENVNISDVVESVMSTARGLVKDKPIELITSLEDDLPQIDADSTRVRQVLLNLMSNAAKFTERGSITVSAQKQTNDLGQPEIYISVTDTGIGIPEENQKRLFEPFVQVDGSPTRTTGGTGLGLSITRMLVELHHGTIGLESKVGKGSKFYFTLPIKGTSSVSKSTLGNPVILAIDDDPNVIGMYERYIADSNLEIVPIKDLSNSVAYAKEIKPFVITLDVNLSDLDGWAIFEELKKNSDTADIPIVICSLEDNTEKGKEMGAAEYLVKPILAEDFNDVINRLWNNASEL